MQPNGFGLEEAQLPIHGAVAELRKSSAPDADPGEYRGSRLFPSIPLRPCCNDFPFSYPSEIAKF